MTAIGASWTGRVIPAACVLGMLAARGNAQCVTFPPFLTVGHVVTGLAPAGTLTEVSGVVASRHNPGVLWVHDDSGNGEALVALRANGSLAQYYVVGGVQNQDWEDIAIGPGPVLGQDYLYIADIGNNGASREVLSLVRIPEPCVPAQPQSVITLSGADVFAFSYPGAAVDSETLLIDPVDGSPYVVSKEGGGAASLFRYPLPLDSSRRKVMVLETRFAANSLITGGDVAPDGSTAYLRDYFSATAYPRPYATSFASAFSQPRCAITTGFRGQGESIAVEPNGLGLIIISEGAGAAVDRSRGTHPSGPTAVYPGWWCFGSGLGGAAGVPRLGADRVPVLGGRLVTLGVFDAAPQSVGLCLLSTTSLPNGVLGFAGGWLHTLPTIAFGVSVDAAGTAPVPLVAFANRPSWSGLQLHAQVLLADQSAPQGVSMSAGLTLQLAR